MLFSLHKDTLTHFLFLSASLSHRLSGTVKFLKLLTMGFKKALHIVPQLEILLPDHKHTFPHSSLRVNSILLGSDIWRSETLNMGLPLVSGILSHVWCMCFHSLSECPFFRPLLLNKQLLMTIYDKVNSNYREILLQTSLRVTHPPTAEINGQNPTEINEHRQ